MQKNNVLSGGGERVAYIDALRGFAMFLVVYAHVINLGIRIPLRSSVVGDFISLFHMPLFFFISGIVAYKSLDKWDSYKLYKGLWQKATQLFIPTLLVMTIYLVVRYGNMKELVNGPGRYWFTYCLFIFFIAYYLMIALFRAIKKSWAEELLMLLSLLAFGVLCVKHWQGTLFNWLQWENFSSYLQFFALGLLCRKHKDAFHRFVSSDWTRTLLVVLSVLLYVCHRWKLLGAGVVESLNVNFVLRILLTLLVYVAFARHRHYFDGESKFVKALRFVGRRTLDIYLLHFFLLLSDLQLLKPWLENNQSPLLELIICGFFAVVVIAITLLLSLLLRSSNFVGRFVLGTKNNNTIVEKWW